MRTAFGLLGILATLGAIVFALSYFASSKVTQTAISNVQQARNTAKQVAGYDQNNRPANESIRITPETSNGKMTSVLVTAIDAGGAMEKHFGLKRGDSIVEIGPLPIKDMSSASEVKDYLLDAFQKDHTLVVLRDEQRVTLPVAVPTPAAASAPKQNDANKSPLQQQLDSISGQP